MRKFYRSVGNVTADTVKHYIANSQGDWMRVLKAEEVLVKQSDSQTTSRVLLFSKNGVP